MADLHLEIARRNARFRAWKAHGVPVEGAWRLEPMPPSFTIAKLKVGCSLCGHPHHGSFGPGTPEIWAMTEIADGLAEQERLAIQMRPDCAEAAECDHLDALLEDDPPEVRATTELELLS